MADGVLTRKYHMSFEVLEKGASRVEYATFELDVRKRPTIGDLGQVISETLGVEFVISQIAPYYIFRPDNWSATPIINVRVLRVTPYTESLSMRRASI